MCWIAGLVITGETGREKAVSLPASRVHPRALHPES